MLKPISQGFVPDVSSKSHIPLKIFFWLYKESFILWDNIIPDIMIAPTYISPALSYTESFYICGIVLDLQPDSRLFLDPDYVRLVGGGTNL